MQIIQILSKCVHVDWHNYMLAENSDCMISVSPSPPLRLISYGLEYMMIINLFS